MMHNNYPPGAQYDSRAPWNQEDEYNEPTRTAAEILEELLESLADLTNPEDQDFKCSTCTEIYWMVQEASEELNNTVS